MVDRERAEARLERLAALLARLERTRAAGIESYLRDEDVRLATERALTVAQQIVIDLGAQLVAELGAPTPEDYCGVFASLAEAGAIDAELAGRLADMARQRDLLVHPNLDADDRLVFASLDRLDDLRAFAAAVERAARG